MDEFVSFHFLECEKRFREKRAKTIKRTNKVLVTDIIR